jgi:tetratricopeptide (TPR) repeat protein
MLDLGRFLDAVVNRPGPRELAAACGAGAALLLIAALLLVLGKLRRSARWLGAAGLALILLALATAHQQTVVEQQSPEVTVTRPRYSGRVRRAIEVALPALPAGVIAALTAASFTTRRRERATVPGHLKEAIRRYYQGDLDGALAQCDLAVRFSPERGDAHYQRGCVYEARGEPDRALEDFDQAARLDPQLVAAFLHRGRLRAGRGDLDGALADFSHALDVRPNNAEALLDRGICLRRKGLTREATADLEWVLHLTNQDEFAAPARQHLRELEALAPSGALAPAPAEPTPS